MCKNPNTFTYIFICRKITVIKIKTKRTIFAEVKPLQNDKNIVH